LGLRHRPRCGSFPSAPPDPSWIQKGILLRKGKGGRTGGKGKEGEEGITSYRRRGRGGKEEKRKREWVQKGEEFCAVVIFPVDHVLQAGEDFSAHCQHAGIAVVQLCLHSMVYVTVGRPSVCPINRKQQRQPFCLLLSAL